MAGELSIRAVEQADLPALLELYRDLNPAILRSRRRMRICLAADHELFGMHDFRRRPENVLVTSCTLVVVPTDPRACPMP